MQLSFKIIKGLEKDFDCRLLELKRDFFRSDSMGTDNAAGEKPDQDVNIGSLTALLIKEAEEKANKILSQARNDAASIVELARKESEKEAEGLKADAAREGFEEGRKEALAKAAADASSIRDQARSVLRQAEEIRRQTLESLESEIVRLAIEMSEKLLSAKLNLDPGVVVETAREAIDALHNRDKVFLRVNPSDEAFFEEKREDLQKHLSPKGELLIITDSDIEPGGCVAETEHGRVNAGLGIRWKELLESLGDMCI